MVQSEAARPELELVPYDAIVEPGASLLQVILVFLACAIVFLTIHFVSSYLVRNGMDSARTKNLAAATIVLCLVAAGTFLFGAISKDYRPDAQAAVEEGLGLQFTSEEWSEVKSIAVGESMEVDGGRLLALNSGIALASTDHPLGEDLQGGSK